MNRAVGEALADHLRGRPAVLRHHDLPWERPQYASLRSWPRTDPAWRHVTINELARHELRQRRGIAATTIYHGFAERPCPEQRASVRRRMRVGDEPLVLQPTRAIARKGIAAGLALTRAIGGTYWLTGPAEDGYQAELDAVLAAGRVPVRRRLPFEVRMAGRVRGLRRGGAALVLGGLRAAADRVGAAPQADRGRRVPGGPRAGGVRVRVVRRRRPGAAARLAGRPGPGAAGPQRGRRAGPLRHRRAGPPAGAAALRRPGLRPLRRRPRPRARRPATASPPEPRGSAG